MEKNMENEMDTTIVYWGSTGVYRVWGFVILLLEIRQTNLLQSLAGTQ